MRSRQQEKRKRKRFFFAYTEMHSTVMFLESNRKYTTRSHLQSYLLFKVHNVRLHFGIKMPLPVNVTNSAYIVEALSKTVLRLPCCFPIITARNEVAAR